MDVYRYCKVQPKGMDNKFYYYISNEEVEPDDIVIIPFGRNDRYIVGTVIDVKYYEREDVPFPLDRMKAIYKVLQPGEIFIEEHREDDTLNSKVRQANNYLFSGRADKAFDWAVKHQYDFHDPEVMDKVVEIFQEFAEYGNADAALNLGVMYYNGTYLEQNYEKAVRFYEISAKDGNTQAMCNLGYCYYYGRHQDVDYEKAYQYFTQGALLDGNPNCLYKLADMFLNGYYVEKDVRYAFQLYQNACHVAIDHEVFDCLADIDLRIGREYLHGGAVACDPDKAHYHLSRALTLFYERRYTDPFVANGIQEAKELLQKCQSMMDREIEA